MTTLLPGQPEADGAPVFREPWEATAFAMAVQLHASGLFTWTEWADALAARISLVDEDDDGDDDAYYQHWLAALEDLVAERGAASADELDATRDAWRHAAGRTPHGSPIELITDDYDG